LQIQYLVELLQLLYNANELRRPAADHQSARFHQAPSGARHAAHVPTVHAHLPPEHRAQQDMSAIDPRAFYVEELESFVNLTEDYIMWHELRHAPPAQRRPFVFCDHPFLFDPPLKSKVLRLEYSILSAAQQGVRAPRPHAAPRRAL
jgi:hypothetical protein